MPPPFHAPRFALWLTALSSGLMAAIVSAQMAGGPPPDFEEEEAEVLPDPDEILGPEEEPVEEERLYTGTASEEEGVGVPHTVCEGRRIRRVRVLGNRRVADEDVLANVRSRAGRVCSDATVTDDAHALWDLGFFDDIQVEATPRDDDRVDLIFRIRERPAIGSVRYDGNSHVSTSDIEEVVNLRIGSILSRPTIAEQVTEIRDLYAEKGYFLARIEPELVLGDDNEVEVVFHIDEGFEVVVRRIRFVGNREISSADLRGIMQTGETGFFSFLSNNDNFEDERFDQDVMRLQALYYDRGYLQMQVGTPRIELTPDRRFIDITIPIAEGPRYRIGRIDLREEDEDGEEVELLGGRRQLREMVRANPGDWFNRTSLAESLLGLTRFYRDQGYAHVEVTPQTDLDPEDQTVDLALVITRGEPTRIERINIRGNTKTRDSVIRRELRIAEGDLYNQTLLETSRLAVQALGYFERVDVSESDGSAPDRIVVNVEVGERATGTFQIGAGFSSIEAFIFTAQVQQQNLFGNGQSLSLQLQLSGLRQLVQLQFLEPYFFGTDWSFAFELFRTVRQFQAFNRDSTGGSLSLGHWILDRRFTFFLQYRADYVNIGPRTGGFFGSGSGQGLFQYQLFPSNNLFRNGLSSSLRLSLTWDSRDNRITPTDGVFASGSVEVADEAIGSAVSFVRWRLFTREYLRLYGTTPNDSVVLRFNTEWGLITSRVAPGPPIYERFYLGGIFSVRGFPLNGLGPRLPVSSAYDPNAILGDNGVPVGGNMQFFYNVELEFPIVPAVNIRGVIFTDGGNAWNLDPYVSLYGGENYNYDPATDARRLDFGDLRTSWGFGVRWISPLGPLRFEWGIPFARRPWESEIDFQFTIGNFF
jgi:outer membrane protein insertion porin family